MKTPIWPLAFAVGAACAAVAPAAAAQSCAQPNKAASVVGTPVIHAPSTKTGIRHGTVVLRIDLSAQGKVTGHEFLERSGNSAMDLEALRGARRMEYTPEIVDCKPVAGSYLFVVVFPPE